MANASYPDDDGSRSPSGVHGEARKGPSARDVQAVLTPTTLADMAAGRHRVNNRTDSSGDHPVGDGGFRVDGDAGGRGGFVPAAYPASSGSDGTG